MKLLSLRCRFALLAGIVLACVSSIQAAAPGQRERILLDAQWRFAIGHATDTAKDFGFATGYFSYLSKTGFGDGPASAAFDDRGWRMIDLPHDYAVEAAFDQRGTASHGFKAIGGQFPAGNIGWYRKTFTVPESDLGRRVQVEFDGAYRNAAVFVNGFFVGQEPSGYVDACYDITDYLKYGSENVIVVRTDATIEEGWFYEGAGIYRHVWLTKTNPLHIAHHGTWVRTELAGKDAALLLETTVENSGTSDQSYDIEYAVLAPDGKIVAQIKAASNAAVVVGKSEIMTMRLVVANPQLWSLETPQLHTLVTTLTQKGVEIDRTLTAFGIRTIRFDPNAGFFLNGQHVVLKGTNNHQDHAGVGAAVPDALQEFRIKRLKEMGSNAYRCSHNPPTPELLDACDRLGMLVIDENRLMGANPYHLGQLEKMILRDRNHPSIILWSIGNEEWGIESNVFGARLAATMQRVVNRLDPTRLATAAISGGWGGISSTIAAPGVNYIKQANPDKQHAEYPWQVILGTEETTTQQTRGIYFDDRPHGHMSPQKDGSSGGNAELGWKYYAARPWAAGVFYWTGFDYRGEPTPFDFPAIASQFGILDVCGFPKDSFFYHKAWWGKEDVLHIFPHWNWPDRVGQPIDVSVNSNCDEVELWLNGTSLGRQKMEINGHLTWSVKYAPGTLLARGYRAGKEIMTTKVETTGSPASIALAADRSELKADGADVSVVTVEIRDKEGRIVPTAGNKIDFRVSGPGRIIGVGNGDPTCLEPDKFVGSCRTEKIGKWRAPEPSIKSGTVSFEASFDLPKLAEGETISLLLNALGTNQTATLNGEPLYQNAAPGVSRAELAIDPKKLKTAGNTLRLEATVFEVWRDRDGLFQFHPATLRIATPPKPWSRSAFNGLAQVIVQTTKKSGTITLETSSDGLTPETLSIKTSQ